MTNYSKRSAKYSKNITPYTKRRRYIRKNSRRNKKIFYGGDIRTFEFTNEHFIKHILTKKKSFLNLRGAGTYTLAMDSVKSPLIDAQSLSEFIVAITNPANSDIINHLYDNLEQAKSTEASFHFESLYYALKLFRILNNDIYDTISPDEFKNILDTNRIGIKYTPDFNDTVLIKQYRILKNIYDILLRQGTSSLQIYQQFPLSKINPVLPQLINNDTPQLGRGGFGIVYRVTYDEQDCALKVIKCNNSTNAFDLMSREVIVYNIISHLDCNKQNTLFCKFISAYYDSTEKLIYVLMEYCGNSLHEIMSNPQTITYIPAHIYKWLINIAKGLQCMHQSKYAHLDIKPDNIVLDTTNLTSKLIDFGFAYDFSRDKNEKLYRGTLSYMPPEMIDKEEITDLTKCDVYSLGITFIECAFAFEYPDIYKNCLSSKASKKLFYSILRYVYSVDQQPDDLILPQYMINSLNKGVTPPLPYNAHTIVYKIISNDGSVSDISYTLSELYTNLFAIHEAYQLFRDMIKTNPGERVRIDTVISKCKTYLS